MIRLIKNGRIIDPANSEDRIRDLWIDASGKISDTGPSATELEPDEVIHADGYWVIPGIVDLAARFREPGQEHKAGICSESAAALASGITTVCIPPDTIPVIDSPAVMELIQQRAQACVSPKILMLGAMSAELSSSQLSELAALKQAGCAGISNGYHPISDSRFMRNVMDYAVSHDLKVHLTPIDEYLSTPGCAHEGQLATRLGLPGIPYAAETAIVARDLALIESSGIHAHFCRISCARSVEMIADAQQQGLPVTADVSAHQLFLTVNDIAEFNSLAHVYPPLRNERDRDALIQGVSEGIIGAICSDHQPHEEDAKLAPFAETEAGMSTMETLLPLCMKLVHEHGLKPGTVINAITNQPAEILGADAGELNPGHSADIVVIDPESDWVFSRDNMISRGKNSYFNNWPFRGNIKHTILNGELVYSCS